MQSEQPLKVLILAAEVVPFAKVGGLADVVGALPKALQALGQLGLQDSGVSGRARGLPDHGHDDRQH